MAGMEVGWRVRVIARGSDLNSGQISREIFVNDEIYVQEQERVFAVLGCLSATVPEPR
jgi:hypothetical protein